MSPRAELLTHIWTSTSSSIPWIPEFCETLRSLSDASTPINRNIRLQMGAAESKVHGNGAVGGEVSSKAKLAFVPGVDAVQSTPVYTLRDAFLGKRPVSVFLYDPAQFELDNHHEFLPKAIKKLKTIRHPSVLRFIDCKTSATGVHLITERVVPLTLEYLEDITEEEILVGLYDILVALHFLHSQCHVSHNNVQLGSIFVSNGQWVLGGMEFTGAVAESVEWGSISLLSKELVPPEHQGQQAEMTSCDMEVPHAIDIWQYGKLIETLIQDGLLHIKPNALELDRILNSDPRKRPSGDTILESDLFVRSNAVSIVRYCRLKGLDKVQNMEWSQPIMPKLHMLPPSIMEKFVLPQLLTQEFFAAEGFDKLYRTLFTPQPPQPLISEEVYSAQVLPFMIKLWTYRQADIRLTILRLFEVYLKAVVLGEGGSEILGQIILPEILAGLQDADPKIYLASLCGLATAVPYALLVTTLGDTDQSKQKFSVKSLYEQTLIPQIMAFWISEDSTQESKMQLIEVVMGMWCSIYTLGLQNHAAVKDMSATLTLTLVSVLKLSPIHERLDLISKSFTKHCTNALFCVSGLLKFLPQFLLDDDLQVREAAARAISTVAHQTPALVSIPELTPEQQKQQLTDNSTDDPSSTAPTPITPSPSAHVLRIRQYCEKQQTLLPPRRPIFSRSNFVSERSLSSLSIRSMNGLDSTGKNHSTTDILSSRRSSMISQDSCMFSEQASLKTSSMTPSLTRTGSFSTESTNKENLGSIVKMESQYESALDKASQPPLLTTGSQKSNDGDIKVDETSEEKDAENAAELELLKALEEAKAEMKMRQLQAESQGLGKPAIAAQTPGRKTNGMSQISTSFGWDDPNDADDADNWDTDDMTSLDNHSKHSSSATLDQPVEDEATRLKREQAQAEKQEQLRQKRDQKQQEMQAKREARRQQMAEKQLQKKASSSEQKLTSRSLSSGPAPLPSSVAPTTATSKPSSVRSMIQLPEGPIEEKDDWGLEADSDMGTFEKQAGTGSEEDLFKDLEVSYKAPDYVGSAAGSMGGKDGKSGVSGSTTSMSSSMSSSMTLSNSVATVSTAKTPHSPTATTSTATTTLIATTTTTTNLSGTFRQGLSPSQTPKRIASPLLETNNNDSLKNSLANSNGNTKSMAATSPTVASVTALEALETKTTPSLALQVDDAAIEEDGWGDDWD
ncbi:Protein-associating with the carboxyl-terminal domain of ezrin [Mortierella polycephala]|uniref:Protein-associating with the carboxyl-terminal domain of ezrin n=1 Tax=Mortierella polycephala TaxID=41804 RepID=A0A9P6U8Y8_9FUNG|nr:Protein-associating with the carboxyl-terminal domain of ezrin [Mortierella polycephala]